MITVNTVTTTLPPYLARLDETQRTAALDINGYVAIHACAGAGKTSVLAARVAYLLDSGIPPEQIVCITFTNKASDEMQSRIESYSGRDLSAMWLGTYHSICARILREFGSAIGISADFTVYDDNQSSYIVRLAAKDAGVTDNKRVRELKTQMDQFKSQTRGLDEWCDALKDKQGEYEADDGFRKIYGCYCNRLRSRNALDFGDLTLSVYRLLESNPDVSRELSSRFRYILVDEYQDTSEIESRILRRLSSVHGNLCVVGDVYQAIFSWRGSDHRLMMNFGAEYPGAKVHLLNTNYRSAKTIVEASQKLISHVIECYHCTAARSSEVGGGVEIVGSASDKVEANVIAGFVEESVSAGLVRYRDIAILSRIKSAAKTLEETFKMLGVPFTAACGQGDYLSSPEAQCALAYLRLALDAQDKEARSQLAWFRDGINESEHIIQKLAGMYACGVTLSQLIEVVSNQVRKDMEVTLMSPGANSLYELKKSALQYNSNASNKHLLPAFLDEISGNTNNNVADTDIDAVQIMTIHQSKGLEFAVVFIVGMEEGVLPSWHSLGDDNAAIIEEERRLCYVAMTRAKDWLCLCHSDYRRLKSRPRTLDKSRFIDESSPTLRPDTPSYDIRTRMR